METDRYHLPLPKTTLDQFVRLIFAPIERGQSLILLFEARAGRRALPKFFISNLDLFKDKIKKGIDNYCFFYIDPPEMTEQSALGYMLLFYQQLFPEMPTPNGSYFEIFDQIKKKVQILSQEKELVFFLNEFDELTFLDQNLANNLKSIWHINKMRIHFVFLTFEALTRPEQLKQFGQLSEAIMENEVKIPPLTKEDMDFIIERQGQFLNYEFDEKESDAIRTVSSGNPYIIKIACRLLSQENKKVNALEFLQNHYQIQVIKEEESGYGKELKINSAGVIVQGEKPINLKLSGKEHDLLVTFLSHPNEILSRDQIGEVLWGKKMHEKYSDWAIDQAIHELREKIAAIGKKKNLHTIRDKGYRYIPD